MEYCCWIHATNNNYDHDSIYLRNKYVKCQWLLLRWVLLRWVLLRWVILRWVTIKYVFQYPALIWIVIKKIANGYLALECSQKWKKKINQIREILSHFVTCQIFVFKPSMILIPIIQFTYTRYSQGKTTHQFTHTKDTQINPLTIIKAALMRWGWERIGQGVRCCCFWGW